MVTARVFSVRVTEAVRPAPLDVSFGSRLSAALGVSAAPGSLLWVCPPVPLEDVSSAEFVRLAKRPDVAAIDPVSASVSKDPLREGDGVKLAGGKLGICTTGMPLDGA